MERNAALEEEKRFVEEERGRAMRAVQGERDVNERMARLEGEGDSLRQEIR